MDVIHTLFVFLGALFRRQAELPAENLALRQQLAVPEQGSKRPRLRNRDRIFWAWLSWLWPNWRSVLVIVQPATVKPSARSASRMDRLRETPAFCASSTPDDIFGMDRLSRSLWLRLKVFRRGTRWPLWSSC